MSEDGEYYKNNKEKMLKRQKEYNKKNKEKIQEYKKEYRKKIKKILNPGEKIMGVNFIPILPNLNLKLMRRANDKCLYFKFEIRKCSTGQPLLYLLLYFNEKIQKILDIKNGDYLGISYNEFDCNHICIYKTTYIRGYKICKNKPTAFNSKRLQTTLRWKINNQANEILKTAKTYKVPFKKSKGKDIKLIIYLKNAVPSQEDNEDAG